MKINKNDTNQNINNKKIKLNKIKNNINKKRYERVINITQSVPNFVSDFPEQEKLIILIDIVGFSKSTTREQVYNIYLFQRFLFASILNNKINKFSNRIKISQFIPTGDGCYIVANKCDPEIALDFIIKILNGFTKLKDTQGNKMYLRVSAIIGKCVPFMDLAKHINYIGEGMNEAARVLSYGQNALEDFYSKENSKASKYDLKCYSRNSIYLDDSLVSGIKEYEDKYEKLILLKQIADKHGKKRDITVLKGIKE